MKTAASPIDLGITFALAYRWVLFAFALPVLAIEIGCDYLVYTRPLLPKQQLMLGLVEWGAFAWLIAAVNIFFIERFRLRTDPPALAAAIRAFIFLPKTFISVTLLMLFFEIYLRFPPFLILLVFFMWGPAFCIAETFVPDPVEEDEDYDDEDEFGPMFRRPLRRAYIFKDKLPWELGFVRSVRFVSQNRPVSFQIALLLWCAEVIPRGLVALTDGPSMAFTEYSASLALAAFARVLVLGAAAAVFVLCLPVRVLEELGVRFEADTVVVVPQPAVRVFRGRAFLFILAAMTAAVFSWYLFIQAKTENILPASAKVEVVEARVDGTVAVLNLTLTDEEHRFRWLEPGNFRLVVRKHEPDSAGASGKDTAHVNSAKEMIAPRLVSIYPSAGGEKLDPLAFKPYYKPLKVLLYFDLKDDVLKFKHFMLYYAAEDDKVGNLVANGTFTKNSGDAAI